jgi:hypothetical protein
MVSGLRESVHFFFRIRIEIINSENLTWERVLLF